MLERDVLVLPAVVEQHRAANGIGAVEHARDARSVVTDRDVRIVLDRHLEGQRAAQAEAEHARPTARDLRQLAQRVQRADRIANRQLRIQLLNGLERLGHAGFVVVECDAPLDPPVEIGRERDVTEPGQAVGGLLDVAADAEDLLEHHDPRAGARVGQRHVGVQVAVGRRHPLDSDRARHSREA